MTLFPISALKPKTRSLRDRKAPIQIPTGMPRLVESSTIRRGRVQQDAWNDLLDAVRRSAAARLDLLKGRSGSDRVSCPWERLMGCDASCRCEGAGTITVEFLRQHYDSLAAQIDRAAQLTLRWRDL